MSERASLLVVPTSGRPARPLDVSTTQLPSLLSGGFRKILDPGDLVFDLTTREVIFHREGRESAQQIDGALTPADADASPDPPGTTAPDSSPSTTESEPPHAGLAAPDSPTSASAGTVDLVELLKVMSSREAVMNARIDKLTELMMAQLQRRPEQPITQTRAVVEAGPPSSPSQQPHDTTWTSSLVHKLGQLAVACSSHAFRQTIKESLK